MAKQVIVRNAEQQKASVSQKQADLLTVEQFTTKAIVTLRDSEKSAGIHTVYSGFNAAFRDYFCEGMTDDERKKAPIAAVDMLEKLGKIQKHPANKGVMIYLPGEMPAGAGSHGSAALKKILGL